MNLTVDIRSFVLTADVESQCDDSYTVAELVYERQRVVASAAADARYSNVPEKITLRDVEGSDGVVHSIYSGFTAGWTLTDGVVYLLMSNGDRIKVVVDEGVDIFEEDENGVMVFPAEPWTRTSVIG